MTELHSGIYRGVTGHKRLRPSINQFVYKLFFFWLDLDELELLQQRRLFSVNRFNLFAFHEKDHFKFLSAKAKRSLKTNVLQYIQERDPQADADRVELPKLSYLEQLWMEREIKSVAA